jgi:hydroxymethylpyrimidine/phosphomethylpyrimidine kinase
MAGGRADMMPVVASIGCSDPWNAAGTGLDIRALAACGVRPVTVIAGVTAQDAAGVHAAQAVSETLLEAQLAALASAKIAAYRIGALLDRASVEIVAAHLRSSGVPSVYDPVFAPSGGGVFAGAALIAAIRDELVPRVTLVTPNLAEAGALTGLVPADAAAMETAGRALVALGAGAALVKGGHLRGVATDVLTDAAGTVAYEAPRLAGTLRGTGCVLACGIAAALARGQSLRDAVVFGRALVRERFASAGTAGGMRLAY